jgi:hypothetical protein
MENECEINVASTNRNYNRALNDSSWHASPTVGLSLRRVFNCIYCRELSASVRRSSGVCSTARQIVDEVRLLVSWARLILRSVSHLGIQPGYVRISQSYHRGG